MKFQLEGTEERLEVEGVHTPFSKSFSIKGKKRGTLVGYRMFIAFFFKDGICMFIFQWG